MVPFDPYFKWLAIPPEEQPPHHYRLLGLPIFLDDVDVIEGAAEQRTIYLRTFQTGPNSELAERLLNEVSEARLCLLTAEDKTEYDKRLHSSLEPTQPILVENPPAREKDGMSATVTLPADDGYQLAELEELTPTDKQPLAYAPNNSVLRGADPARDWRTGGKQKKPLWQEPWAVPVAAGGVVIVVLLLMLLTSWIGRLGDPQNGPVTAQQGEDQQDEDLQAKAAAEKAAAEKAAAEKAAAEKRAAEFAREDQAAAEREAAFLAVARRRGNRYLANEEFDKAITDYTEAIRINPDDARAYHNRGIAYSRKEELDKAIADYTDAIRINPDYATAYHNRGIAYDKVGDVDKAIANLREAIRINPDNALAHRKLGDIVVQRETAGAGQRSKPSFQFAVNTTSDTVDADPGNGVAQDSQGKTSLRAAIMEANALEGRDLILLPKGTFTLSIAGVGEENSASGDLDIKSDMTIVGEGSHSTIINGNLLDRVLDISGNVSLSRLTVTGGRPPGPRQRGNGYGGGVAISKGTVTMDEVTVSGNHGAFGTGGIVVAGATLTLTDSTISGNTTPFEGGGIAVHSRGTANIINSTISDNRADNGAGIAGSGDGTLITITNSTITGNSAKFGGGGLKINGGTVRLQNTIVSSNTAGSGPDIYGTVQSLGNNLVRKTIGSTGLVSSDLKNVDPTLGPLDDNGGTTLTHALLAGSPAIDAGNNSAAPETDQRGISRPIDGDSNGTNIVDIGASEFKP